LTMMMMIMMTFGKRVSQAPVQFPFLPAYILHASTSQGQTRRAGKCNPQSSTVCSALNAQAPLLDRSRHDPDANQFLPR
jgi:hypothetical protein